MEDKYAWQKLTYDLWKNNGYKGLVKGVCSSGKTRAGCNCIEGYRREFPNTEIWILAPTNEILDQWKKEPQMKGVENIQFMTYITAVNRLIRRYEADPYDVPDLLILDEAHSALAPVAGRVLNFGVPHILALSGTPNGVEKFVGGVFQEVSWDSANIAPTTIRYVIFPITAEEKRKYDQRTQSIEKYKADHPYSHMWNDDILSMMYLRRRDLVYKMKSRLPIALKLVKQNLGRRMMIFFERTKQVQEFAKMLDKEGIDYCVHVNGDEHLNEYIDGLKDIVLCVHKLQSGFSSPSTEVGIIVSTALGKANHIQRVGRIIRPKDNKHADIYVLLAKDTNDIELFNDRNQMFPKEMIERVDWSE